MHEGVPLNQLHCPTCRELFIDYNLYSDAEPFPVSQIASPILAFAIGKKFLRCPQGHKWTVKTIWRRNNHPDYIQLDEYMGTD